MSARKSVERSEPGVVFLFYGGWEWEAGRKPGAGTWVRKFSVSRGSKGCGGWVRVDGTASDAPKLTDEETRSKVKDMIDQSTCIDTSWVPGSGYLTFSLSIIEYSDLPRVFGA
jgi:transglutaminase-like putative cysteine protease